MSYILAAVVLPFSQFGNYMIILICDILTVTLDDLNKSTIHYNIYFIKITVI